MEMAADLKARDFLNRHFIDRFVPIHDRDYGDIRRMCWEAESADFETIR